MRCGRPEGSCHVEWRQVDPSTGSSGHAGSESWYLLKKQKFNQKYKQNLRNLQAKLIKKEMQGKDCSGWIRQTGLNEGSDKNWQTKGLNYHWTHGGTEQVAGREVGTGSEWWGEAVRTVQGWQRLMQGRCGGTSRLGRRTGELEGHTEQEATRL